MQARGSSSVLVNNTKSKILSVCLSYYLFHAFHAHANHLEL
jgi:hypothetical protein